MLSLLHRNKFRFVSLLKSLSGAIIITTQKMSQVSLLKSLSGAIIITQQQISRVSLLKSLSDAIIISPQQIQVCLSAEVIEWCYHYYTATNISG